MLKGSENLDDSSHFSYREYKRKVKKNNNQDVLIFCSVFLVALIVLLGFAKILSPNVDVSIASSDEIVYEEEAPVSEIDERLKHLQMEDEGKTSEMSKMFSPELDEKVVLPQQRKKTVGEVEAEKNTILGKDLNEVNDSVTRVKKQADESLKASQKEALKEQEKATPLPVQIVNAKVVVGYYATEKQAEVARTIIKDAGLGVSPIVKNVGGYYTLQVGSYSSKEKAQIAANELLKSNFPARVIVE